MFFNDFIKVYPFSLLKIDIYSVENRSVVLKKVIKLDKGIQHFPKKKKQRMRQQVLSVLLEHLIDTD